MIAMLGVWRRYVINQRPTREGISNMQKRKLASMLAVMGGLSVAAVGCTEAADDAAGEGAAEEATAEYAGGCCAADKCHAEGCCAAKCDAAGCCAAKCDAAKCCAASDCSAA